MSTAAQRRPQTSAPSDGSRTITLRDAQPRPEASRGGAGPSTSEPDPAVGVLKLRGAQRRTRQHVVWDADVVDNEGSGKKKSKICCIYHKSRRFDESSSSSSESESDSDSAPDLESDEGGGQRRGDDRARSKKRHRHARHGRGCGHKAARREGQNGTIHELHELDSDSDVNAYEMAPKRKG